MARYIDAEMLVKSIEKRRLVFKDTITVAEALAAQGKVIRAEIENAPTADVVPRSEYEKLAFQFRELDIECDRLEKVEEQYNKLKSEVEELKKIYQTYNKAIKHERQELAREIFAEVERFLFKNKTLINITDFAELKKKHIGE